MTADEVERGHKESLAQGRRDDEYRQQEHAAWLARLGQTLDLLKGKAVRAAKFPLGWPGQGWIMVEVEFHPRRDDP